LDYISSVSHSHKFLFFIVTKFLFIRAVLSSISVLFDNPIGNQINISIEDWLEIWLDSLNLWSLSSINSNYLDSITWSHAIYVRMIWNDCYGMGSLAFCHEFRQFLYFHKLFVVIFWKIMIELISKFMSAWLTLSWFLYHSIIELNLFCMSAVTTDKASVLHVRVNFWCPYDYSFESQKPIDVLRSEVFDLNNFVNMVKRNF